MGPYRDVLTPDFIFHMLINFMFLGIYPFLLGCLICWYMIVNSISWSLLFLFFHSNFKIVFFQNEKINFYFFIPRGMWNFSHQGWNQYSHSGSTESWALDHQGSPDNYLLLPTGDVLCLVKYPFPKKLRKRILTGAYKNGYCEVAY